MHQNELPTGHEIAREKQRAVVAEGLLMKGWSQADLVKATGLPRYTVSRVARGETLASEEVASKLEQALGLSSGVLARASKRAARATVPEGVYVRPLGGGQEHVQLSMTLDSGARMAIEAIAKSGTPISYRRLASILMALTQPIPAEQA